MTYTSPTTASVNPFDAARVRPKQGRRVYARLPLAPVNASPVPRLTSLYHHDEALDSEVLGVTEVP